MTSDSPTLFPGPDPDVETLRCSECGAEFTGPPKGKGSAPFLLGRHMYNAHQRKADGTRKRATKASREADVQSVASPGMATVSSITSQIRGSGTPSAQGLSDGLGVALSEASLYLASLAVESDKTLATRPELREGLIDELTLPPEAAKKLFEPIGRMLAPTKLNAKYGRQAVDTLESLPAVFELVRFGNNWRQYLAVRAEGNRLMRQYQQQQTSPGAPLPQTPGAPGEGPPPFDQNAPTSGAMTEGRVWSGPDWTQGTGAGIRADG